MKEASGNGGFFIYGMGLEACGLRAGDHLQRIYKGI